MTTISESSYAKSIANFESLLITIRSFGSSYNPVKESIMVPIMEALLAQAKESLTEYDTAKSIYSTSVDAQKDAFKPIGQLITRVRNALQASDSTAENNRTAETIFRKLKGQRASAKLTKEEKVDMEAEGKTVNQISVSQMGYNDRIGNMRNAISLLSTIPAYNPNEADLKVAALSSLADQLQEKNTNVTSAFVQFTVARNKRNEIIRGADKSLAKTASDAKAYIKSLFGVNSTEYKQISKISIK
jgi:hypothetical protein